MQRLIQKTTIVLVAMAFFALTTAVAFAFLTTDGRGPRVSPWLPVTNQSSLPEDGQPRLFPVFTPRRDAWTQLPDEVVGHVYLRRLPGEGRVLALRPEHHDQLRISVVYDETQKVFRSRCWSLRFDLDGQELDRPGQARVGHMMPSVPVRCQDGQVFVRVE